MPSRVPRPVAVLLPAAFGTPGLRGDWRWEKGGPGDIHAQVRRPVTWSEARGTVFGLWGSWGNARHACMGSWQLVGSWNWESWRLEILGVKVWRRIVGLDSGFPFLCLLGITSSVGLWLAVALAFRVQDLCRLGKKSLPAQGAFTDESVVASWALMMRRL